MMRKIWELRTISKNKKMSASEVEELREKKLRAIIRNAYDHVPYYRSLFRSTGLVPEDVRTVQDLSKLPVTTKDDLRGAGVEKITADWVDLSACTSTQTHGSTGKPLIAYQTQFERASSAMLEMASLMAMGVGPRDRLVTLGMPHQKSRSWYQHLGLYRSWSVSVLTPVQEQLRQLRELQPTVLVAYPTALRALVHFSKHPLGELMNPRILIHSGEVFDQVLRERVTADLDSEPFDHYAARELGPIAWECPSHDGLHLNADHYILECLDGEGTSVTGAPGVAVFTSLFGFAMPFIRYKLGDLCALLDRECTCGCSFPLMDHPIGRENDMVTLPSGKLLSPTGFGLVLREIRGMTQWRLIQERPDHFVLKLVMREKPDESVLREIRLQCLAYAEESVRFDIHLVDYIEEGTKFRYIISKVNSQNEY